MKILVVIGDCIKSNSSANLCHIAYLKGLSELGHEITLVTCDETDYTVDSSITLPNDINLYRIRAISMYQKLSIKKQVSNNSSSTNTSMIDSNSRSGESFTRKIKSFLLSLYGVYGITAPFIRESKKFKSDILFDCTISLSYPEASHMATYKLIKLSRIKTKRWIQIWEDPWYSDVYYSGKIRRIYNEEKKLLSFAEEVYYVSPLTLSKCKKLYPESAEKMRWQPLPYYYSGDSIQDDFNKTKNYYGYFGDYVPVYRDLKPFYEAAKKCKIEVNICGKPNNLFKSTEKISVFPRLTLENLKPLESKTNVLVFLCNRHGGQIPGKIYQYSATSKKILFIIDGTEEEKTALKSFFSQFNRYVFCENTVEDITRAILDIENDRISNVINRPLEEFAPKRIIENILNGKNGF